jgi:hypothetical protein
MMTDSCSCKGLRRVVIHEDDDDEVVEEEEEEEGKRSFLRSAEVSADFMATEKKRLGRAKEDLAITGWRRASDAMMSDSTLPVAVPVTAITGTDGIHSRTLPISRYSRLRGVKN